MLTLVLPDESSREDVLSFYAEIEKHGDTCIGFAYRGDYDRWLHEMRCRYRGEKLPDGYVRENFYLCYEGGRLVGVLSIKHELTDYLLKYGGHVGYAVRPSERGRGVAARMLSLGLEEARKIGLDRVLCVCDEDNAASERVIVKNGGTFENSLYDPEEAVSVKRYWIDLHEG